MRPTSGPVASARVVPLIAVCAALSLAFGCDRTRAADPSPAQPATDASDKQDKVGHFPHVEFSVPKRQVRVECQALAVDAPLEFFCCLAGTNEHEAVLRTSARPSDIHTGLLAVGLKPGAPLTFVESTKQYVPPHGPPLHITVEFQKDGKTVSCPAYRWLREIKSKKEPAAFSWVFCGSRVTGDGRYAADDTGYVCSIVNFDYTMIDVPQLASSSNEELEWERNAPLMPPKGTTVWMVIEPTGAGAPAGAGGLTPQAGAPAAKPADGAQPASAAPAAGPTPAAPGGKTTAVITVDTGGNIRLNGTPISPEVLQTALGRIKEAGPLNVRVVADPKAAGKAAPALQAALAAGAESITAGAGTTAASRVAGAVPGADDVHTDSAKVEALVKYHDQVIAPQAAALRQAAQAHYEVISGLRKEQQRLITEADLLQRTIDDLEKKYADMTTPHPADEKPLAPGEPSPPARGEPPTSPP